MRRPSDDATTGEATATDMVRPDREARAGRGRRASLEDYFATVAPTTASHCLATTSLAAPCSARVGKIAFS